VKHIENEGISLLTIYAVIAAAVIGVIPRFGLSWGSVFLLPFLALFSLSNYFAFLKLNVESVSRIITIHWILEKLELIRKMTDKEREAFETSARRYGN